MKTSEPPVIIEQTFSHRIDVVWKAITDITWMRQWYFENIPDFKPEIGFETRFEVQSGARNFPHLWKVTGVIQNKLIKYNWRYDGYAGDSFVVFELFERNSSTLLRLSVIVEEDFADDIPEFTRESCLQGWTYLIKERLAAFLNKVKVD